MLQRILSDLRTIIPAEQGKPVFVSGAGEGAAAAGLGNAAISLQPSVHRSEKTVSRYRRWSWPCSFLTNSTPPMIQSESPYAAIAASIRPGPGIRAEFPTSAIGWPGQVGKAFSPAADLVTADRPRCKAWCRLAPRNRRPEAGAGSAAVRFSVARHSSAAIVFRHSVACYPHRRRRRAHRQTTRKHRMPADAAIDRQLSSRRFCFRAQTPCRARPWSPLPKACARKVRTARNQQCFMAHAGKHSRAAMNVRQCPAVWSRSTLAGRAMPQRSLARVGVEHSSWALPAR